MGLRRASIVPAGLLSLLLVGFVAAPAGAPATSPQTRPPVCDADHPAGRAVPKPPAACGDVDDVSSPARVVVAAIDSAINPYHEFFHHGGQGPYVDVPPSAVTPAVLAEFGIGEDQIIDVTRTGDMEADIAADEAAWATVESGRPYWFRGTNVIAISFGTQPPLKPTPDKDPHGVDVTAAVLNANPEAVVVLVESPILFPPIESQAQLDAEAWAHTFPAVDITTTSYGWPGSPPVPAHLSSTYTGVVTNGKLHVGAVDNSPALSPIDTTGGPWWSIGIAGWQEGSSEGREVTSGTFPDFVGDFTQDLPDCMDCQSGTQSVSGTSFASPRSAGTVSAILLAARRAAGHEGGIRTAGADRPLMVDGSLQITNWQLRRALEEAAVYPSMADYTNDLPWAVPFPDPAPWLVGGWGAITPDPDRGVVTEALAHLGIGDPPTRHKSAEICLFMTAQFEARYAYWNSVAFLGESWLEDDDPYLRC